MSEKSLIAKGKEAFMYHEKLTHLIKLSKLNFLSLGAHLLMLKKDNFFKKAVGAGIDTWEDYLAQPEINISPGEASRLMQIYDYFVVQLKYPAEDVSNIPIKNLHYLLPIIKKESDERVRELFDDAKVLSQKDFKIRVAEYKVPENKFTYDFLVMKKCNETGLLSKVHGIPGEEIKKFIEKYA